MTTKAIEDTFDLLEEGERNIKLSANKKVVLVLGKSGSGKSTLTQFIAGDNEQLISSNVNGVFVIRDANNRAGHSSISHTVFPELVVDVKTNTAFYDCPGFADNRDLGMDIASTYFIKRVIDEARSVKIILTVSYSAISILNDRGEHFKAFLEHAINFIKDIDKFKNSISLIVTKVPNDVEYDDNEIPTRKTDDNMLTLIVDFLEVIKTELKDVSQFKNYPQLHASAMSLIEILLVKEEGKYQKIGIFRMPLKEGPLSNMKLLQDGKRNIEKIIQQNTKFTAKSKDDFGYTVSEASKNNIHNLVNELNNRITFSVAKTGTEIEEFYRSKVEQSTDIHKLKRELKNECEILSEMVTERTTLTTEALLKKILAGRSELGIQISPENLKILYHSNKYLNLFQIVSNQPLVTRPLEWVEPLKDTVKYVQDLTNWYQFLIDLFDKLSGYDIQKDTKKYNVANLEDWGLNGKAQGIKITHGNLKQYLSKLPNIGMQGYNDIKDSEVDNSQLNALNYILYTTLKQTPETVCLPEKITIRGRYIKSSEISRSQCGNQVTVEIFALNTVFIDSDLEFVGQKMQLAILAPKWVIIGTRKINLDGSPGARQGKADDNKYPEGRGTDGHPGLPGGSAGCFLGIGNEFINGQDLTITANGGKGGDGQDGGDGGKGRQGESPTEDNRSRDKFTYMETGKGSDTDVDILFFKQYTYYTYYDVYGKAGTIGGNGGDGGIKALGGYGGDVRMIEWPNNSQILVRSTKGHSGIDGVGGKGGRGGGYGNTLKIKSSSKSLSVAPCSAVI